MSGYLFLNFNESFLTFDRFCSDRSKVTQQLQNVFISLCVYMVELTSLILVNFIVVYLLSKMPFLFLILSQEA